MEFSSWRLESTDEMRLLSSEVKQACSVTGSTAFSKMRHSSASAARPCDSHESKARTAWVRSLYLDSHAYALHLYANTAQLERLQAYQAHDLMGDISGAVRVNNATCIRLQPGYVIRSCRDTITHTHLLSWQMAWAMKISSRHPSSTKPYRTHCVSTSVLSKIRACTMGTPLTMAEMKARRLNMLAMTPQTL